MHRGNEHKSNVNEIIQWQTLMFIGLTFLWDL